MKTRNLSLAFVLFTCAIGVNADVAVVRPGRSSQSASSNEMAGIAGSVRPAPGAPMKHDPMKLDIAAHGHWQSGWVIDVAGLLPVDVQTFQVSLGHWNHEERSETPIDEVALPVGRNAPFHTTFHIPSTADQKADLRLRLHGLGEGVALDRNLRVRLGDAAETGRPDAVEMIASDAEVEETRREQRERKEALPGDVRPGGYASQAITAGSTTITGRFTFTAPIGVQEPLTYVTMEVWDRDEGGATDDRLLTASGSPATAYTDVDGKFTIQLKNYTDEDGTKADVFFVVIASTNKHKVLTLNGGKYLYSTAVFDWDLPWDAAVTMNENVPMSGDVSKAFWINRSMGRGWKYFNEQVQPAYPIGNMVSRFPADGYTIPLPCWSGSPIENTDALFNPCDGAMYFGSWITGDSIHLHEFAHLVMFRLMGNYLPTSYACDPHHFDLRSSESCAWVEGWASFLSGVIRNSRNIYLWDGTRFDMETHNSGHKDDDVEGRVAAMLWDLHDAQNDGRDQNIAYATASPDGAPVRIVRDIIEAMYRGRPSTALEFVRNWGTSSVTQKGVNAVKVGYQNTFTNYYFLAWPDYALFDAYGSVPASMATYAVTTVQVRMFNIGGTAWQRSSMHRLGSVGDATTWGPNRVEIPGSGIVPPGASVEFSFPIQAPASAGYYNFQWRMLKELQYWFGDVSPVKSINVYYGGPCSPC
jgi:hypothetical protein